MVHRKFIYMLILQILFPQEVFTRYFLGGCQNEYSLILWRISTAIDFFGKTNVRERKQRICVTFRSCVVSLKKYPGLFMTSIGGQPRGNWRKAEATGGRRLNRRDLVTLHLVSTKS
jgi:hypothetical protein